MQLQQTLSVLGIVCATLAVSPADSYAQTDPAAAQPDPAPQETFFGQTPPGAEAVPFAPDVLIHEAHDSPLISPDQQWLLFQGMEVDLLFYAMVDGRLTAAENPLGIEFPEVCNGVAMTPSGDRLYIEEWKDNRNHLYCLDREKDKWTSPTSVDLGSATNWWQLSFAANGSLYLASDKIMVSPLKGGSHVKPVPLKLEDGSDMIGATPFIAPDESYLIYSIEGDLHISYPRNDGTWTLPRDLGPNINSDQLDLCPQITPDGKYLLFNTRRNFPDFAIYWADAGIVEDLRPKDTE